MYLIASYGLTEGDGQPKIRMIFLAFIKESFSVVFFSAEVLYFKKPCLEFHQLSIL